MYILIRCTCTDENKWLRQTKISENLINIGPTIWGVTDKLVEQALKTMKVGKAPGLSGHGVTSYLIKAAGATGVKGLFQVCE